MSLWGCKNGHIAGPGSEVACFVCGAPTSRVERIEVTGPTPGGFTVSTAQQGGELVIDDTDECEACQ